MTPPRRKPQRYLATGPSVFATLVHEPLEPEANLLKRALDKAARIGASLKGAARGVRTSKTSVLAIVMKPGAAIESADRARYSVMADGSLRREGRIRAGKAAAKKAKRERHATRQEKLSAY